VPKKKTRPPQAASVPDDSPAERLLSQLDEKIRQLALVNGILRRTVGATSLGDVLGVFASNLKESVPFDRMSVALYDAAAKVFRVPFIFFGGRLQENREPPRPYDDTPLSKVIETMQPMLRKNISADMSFARDREFVKKGLTCEMIFPLVAGTTAFGTYQMSAFEPGRLNERHLATVNDLIPAVTVVVHQFRTPGI